MANIVKPKTFTAGQVALSADVNSDFDTIYNDYNGNIDNSNIAATAAIVDTKLAQISTASKVSGTALTGLASVPSGAGEIPEANIPTISTLGKVNTSALTTTSKAAGDVLYNDGTNWVRLAKDAGKYLKSGASAVSWDTPAQVGFGTRDGSSWSDGTAYLAATDGFVTTITSSADTVAYGYTDASNPPTTNVVSGKSGFCMPVKKGQYWKTSSAYAIYWLPLGS